MSAIPSSAVSFQLSGPIATTFTSAVATNITTYPIGTVTMFLVKHGPAVTILVAPPPLILKSLPTATAQNNVFQWQPDSGFGSFHTSNLGMSTSCQNTNLTAANNSSTDEFARVFVKCQGSRALLENERGTPCDATKSRVGKSPLGWVLFEYDNTCLEQKAVDHVSLQLNCQKPQLPVQRSVTLVSSIVVKRRR